MTTTQPSPSVADAGGASSPTRSERRFPDPYEIATPAGAEGWEEMYPYHNRFLDLRRERDSARTWFRNGMHFPEPMPPFDIITSDSAFMSTGVMNTRVFSLPPALGIDVRVLNGYVYMSANGVEDPAEIGRRAQDFAVRVGYYYQNWPAIYQAWEGKIRNLIATLKAIEIPALGELEPLENVLANRGVTTSNDFLVAYLAILGSLDAAWNLHSELLNMGYAAYLNFLTICQGHFPEITDQSVAKMVSGVDVLLFRPDDELKKLAALGITLGLSERLTAGNVGAIFDDLADAEKGREWIAAYEESADPWFNFSNGNGFYHHHRSWSNDPTFPLSIIGDYVQRLQRGEDLSRPLDTVMLERDRVVDQYRSMIDEDSLQQFDEALGLSRVVFPYVENHNFFIEHWYMTTFWDKMREVGEVFVRFGFFEQVDDLFFLRRAEILDAVADLQMSWCGGGRPAGPDYWPPLVAERRRIHENLRLWQAPPALGPAPAAIVEPMTIMLWGITDGQVKSWLDAQDGGADTNTLKGFAGSPGVAEGHARVILNPRDLDTLVEGEILVAPITSPSWTPVFARIKATVSDIGGIMCHAAIVSREYGLPAVVGTGTGTQAIRTGQLIRVDGNTGTVTLLSE